MMRFDKKNDVLGTVNRGNPTESGLCTLCRADCQGKCETWLSSMVGRKLLYPRDFGLVTAGANNTTAVGVSYNSLRIQGYAYGSQGLKSGLSNDPDDCIFPNVDLTTEFGQEIKTKARIPLMTGALGSTFIAAKYWDSFAIGGALAGMLTGSQKSQTEKSLKRPNWIGESIPICGILTAMAPLLFR